MKKVRFLIDYFKYLKNPISALLFKFGFKKECEIKIKNSQDTIVLKTELALNRLMILLTTTKHNKYQSLL